MQSDGHQLNSQHLDRGNRDDNRFFRFKVEM